MFEIGYWVRRKGAGAKWHLIESDIAGDAVTHCGRRMKSLNDEHPIAPLQFSTVMPLTRMIGQAQLCRQCQ